MVTTSKAVIEVFDPRGRAKLNRSELREIFEVSISDANGLTDVILKTWESRRKERTQMPDEDLGIAQVAINESAKLINYLQRSRESTPASQGTITVGLRLSARDGNSFLAQFSKVLQNETQKTEVLAESDTAKRLSDFEIASSSRQGGTPRNDASLRAQRSNLAVRSIKPMDWQRGFRALRSEQEDVPVALDGQAEIMNSMFTGFELGRNELRASPVVEDFKGLLAAVSLVTLAKISADPKHRSEFRRFAGNPKAKAGYLRDELRRQLSDLGYPPEMFTVGSNGYLEIDGTVANLFLEMKARAEIRKAA